VIELSIIIVNYKTPRLVLDCLQTVYGQTSAITFEVLVADNASGDDSREIITGRYPGVRWIQMDYNAGFARANNAAIRQSDGNAVLLLNPDTLIEDSAIERCYRLFAGPQPGSKNLISVEGHIARGDQYVACGVQLLNPDRSPQISGNFFMKGGLNYLLPLPYLGGWVKWAGKVFKVARPNVPDANDLVEVDWINGAYLMVKKTAIDKAGLMDEDFFLYAEEAEWCSRLKKQGKLCIYGNLHVIHLQGESANKTFGSAGKGYYNLYDRKGLQIMLSNFVRIRKQFGVGWFLVQLGFYVLDIPVFFAGMLLSYLFMPRKDRFTFSQFRNFCKNIGFVIGKSPVIIRNKPYFYKVL
jgi:GT2 family glycosyltransferase